MLRYTSGSDGQLVINSNEAQIVRWIFERYLVGDSLGKIASGMERQGIPSASPYTIISLAMLYALWQSSRKDLLDLIRPFVLYAVGNTLKLILLLYVIIWKESWDTNPSKLLS